MHKDCQCFFGGGGFLHLLDRIDRQERGWGMTRGKCCRARESNLRRHQAAPGLRYALNHIVTAHPNPTLDAERIGSYFDSLWYDPAGDRTPDLPDSGRTL